jgi:hypothetical protein
MSDDSRTEPDRGPERRDQRRPYVSQRETGDGDPNRTCGACGEPINGEAYFTAWGPVHQGCRERPE